MLAALARQGLRVEKTGPVWSVRSVSPADAPEATVLLPEGFPLEGKALRQLANLAGASHPAGGRVVRCCASPDFHPGDSGVAIGSIARMEGMVLPAAVGSDINCGMRLHVVDLDVHRFERGRARLIELLKDDLLLGNRDLPMTGAAFRALFRDGLLGLLEALRHDDRAGLLARLDLSRLEHEVERVFSLGTFYGDPKYAPSGLMPAHGHVRDGGLGTIGGGNHFVELQVVEDILDPALAWEWGVRRGQIAVMIHSGSRHVGKHVGRTWRDKARAAWPRHTPHPTTDLFPLSTASDPELVDGYLRAEATASHYGFWNRALLAELVRGRLVEVFGDLDAPLVFDLPHNITLREGDGFVVRKGACPARARQPVIIPGSMGAASFLLVGEGADVLLHSASHGAGRARPRIAMGRLSEEELALGGVTCITLRQERRIEEAPGAYKPIGPVIDAQVDAGAVRVVARLRPLLTFKG